jgi:hypothetical protein
VCFDRTGTIEGFAKAGNASIRFDMDPQDIGKFVYAVGFDCCDLHFLIRIQIN